MMYGGIYRALCTSNNDPEALLRIRVSVATVYGEGNESDWAWPCFPPGWTAGLMVNHSDPDGAHSHSLVKSVPNPGEPVWVMFEAGNPAHPVWLGQWKVTGA